MTVLAMLRHAETAWSSAGRIQGRTDVPLSDAGRMALRGRALAKEFRNMRVVTSPLRRCVETADQLGLLAQVREDRLVEMRWGDWEGRVLAELRAELGDAMRENEARGFDFAPPGGESPRGVLARVGEWLAEVAKDGRPTLAITHRGVIRVIFAAASHWDMRGRPPLKLDWGAVQIFSLDRAGVPSVLRLNVPLGAQDGNIAKEPAG
ncbi:MAG: histidine phosphatase family protein [Betaproteobacteria bacterium]|nr:histidine phosphatase family protein [Betaproteobacteria bacterium]